MFHPISQLICALTFRIFTSLGLPLRLRNLNPIYLISQFLSRNQSFLAARIIGTLIHGLLILQIGLPWVRIWRLFLKQSFMPIFGCPRPIKLLFFSFFFLFFRITATHQRLVHELLEPRIRVRERLLILVLSEALRRSYIIFQVLIVLLDRPFLFNSKVHLFGKLLGNFRSYFILDVFLDYRPELFFQFFGWHDLGLEDIYDWVRVGIENIVDLSFDFWVNSLSRLS